MGVNSELGRCVCFWAFAVLAFFECSVSRLATEYYWGVSVTGARNVTGSGGAGTFQRLVMLLIQESNLLLTRGAKLALVTLPAVL